MKFPLAGRSPGWLTRISERAAERYRRDQALIDRILVLSAGLLMVIAVMAVLIRSAAGTTLAVFAFGAAIGFSVMLTLGLAIGFSELRRRGRKRRNK